MLRENRENQRQRAAADQTRLRGDLENTERNRYQLRVLVQLVRQIPRLHSREVIPSSAGETGEVGLHVRSAKLEVPAHVDHGRLKQQGEEGV